MSPDARLTTIAASVIRALPCCDDPPIALALLRALAAGHPVPDTELAAATGRDQAQVTTGLARWPNIHRDERGRVIAFSGLSLRPTAHRFEVGECELFTWCAWDTLFLPALLDQPAVARSRCPATGAGVRLTVEPECASSPARTPPTTSCVITRPRPRSRSTRPSSSGATSPDRCSQRADSRPSRALRRRFNLRRHRQHAARPAHHRCIL